MSLIAISSDNNDKKMLKQYEKIKKKYSQLGPLDPTHRNERVDHVEALAGSYLRHIEIRLQIA